MSHQPSPSLLSAATDAIYRAWLPLIGATEAREQAQAFANRFHIRPADQKGFAPCSTTA
jgi:hypothetical protein